MIRSKFVSFQTQLSQSRTSPSDPQISISEGEIMSSQEYQSTSPVLDCSITPMLRYSGERESFGKYRWSRELRGNIVITQIGTNISDITAYADTCKARDGHEYKMKFHNLIECLFYYPRPGVIVDHSGYPIFLPISGLLPFKRTAE